MSQQDVQLRIKTKSGDLPTEEIPVVITEATLFQNCRLILTMSLLIVTSIIFLATLNSQDHNKFHDANINTDELPISYRNGSEIYKNYVIGNKIQVYSNLNNLKIDYIIPQINQDQSRDLYVPNLSDHGKGSVFTLNLPGDQPISAICVVGPSDVSEQKKLDTAKIMVRNSEGLKVWSSLQFLKPQRINLIRVTSN